MGGVDATGGAAAGLASGSAGGVARSAPVATDVSGWSSVDGISPVWDWTMLAMRGIREEPPTR